MPPHPRTAWLRMRARRTRRWLSEFRWWAILALLAGVLCLCVAWITDEIAKVIAVGALSVTLAILATREESP